MTANNIHVHSRIIRRLKGIGLVPQGDPVRLVSHRGPVRWHAEHAVTKQPYHVGGTVPLAQMYNKEWEAKRDGDFTVLAPGDLIPPSPLGGREPPPAGKGRRREYPI